MNRYYASRGIGRLILLMGTVLLLAVFSFAQTQSDRNFIKHELFSGYSTSSIERSLIREAHEGKSVLKAVVLSLLVPGMGELYADRFDVGRYVVISESALWITYAGFRMYGGLVRNDAHDFAKVHAQIDAVGKSGQFYVDIGNFRDVFEYNEKQLRDREIQKLYDPNGGFFWRWDDDRSRVRYRDLRVSSDVVFNNSRFVIAAVIVNHLVSALNAARLTVAHNRAADGDLAFDVRVTVLGGLGHEDGLALTVTKSF
ncbi:MAG: hypothetical protein ACE5H0_02450 [Bacteroidota bacterium]